MKHILIIEDNEGIRENAVEMLELEGYKLTAAVNGNLMLVQVPVYCIRYYNCRTPILIINYYTS